MNKALLLPLIVLLFTSFPLSAQECKSIPSVKPPSDGKMYDWCYTKDEGLRWDTSPYKAYIINGLPFRLLYPADYDPTSTEKYPLVILLHGIGEYGTDNDFQLKFGGSEHLQAVKNKKYNGFVMVPQSPAEFFNKPEQLSILAFVEYAINNLHVDQFKVQIQGYSGGGTIAWKMANWHPKIFTAAIPMSSADGKFARENVENLKYTAIWHTQGGRDQLPKASTGNTVASIFQSVGANYTYYFYPELGHGTWNTTYKEPDFFPFMNRNAMYRIHVRFFKFNFCEGEEIKGTMGVKQGFDGYEWRKNGSLIEGANENEYNFTSEGAYTVRIKHKGEWSVWSDPQVIERVGPTATPTIEVSGPTALPTLDGKNSVTLKAPRGQQAYKWSDGSTKDHLVITKAGTYSVSVTEPFGCPSAYSAPVKVTYNSIVLPAPTNFTVATISQSALKLNWSDNSDIEKGFEIYRSITGESDDEWTLIAQIAANKTSYTDKELPTYLRYHYAIRAVNDDGSSEYAYATGKTKADFVAPSVPQSLEVYQTTRTSIGLQWIPSTDNIDGKGAITYEIFTNNGQTLVGTTTNSEIVIHNLAEEQFYNFVVRASDQLGNTSAFSNQVVAGTYIDGLTYTYHEGTIRSVHDIALLPTLKKGRIPNFDIITPRPSGVEDYFAFTFEGYIIIPTSGDYTFYTESNDGSKLYIDGKQIVDNDGVHSSRSREGDVTLSKGLHHIKVLYFDNHGGGEILKVSWEGPGISKQVIPDAAFKEDFTPPVPPSAPKDLKATVVDEESIDLQWTNTSENATGIEIYHSTSNDGPFVLRKTEPANTTTYRDKALLSGTTYYYKIRAISGTGESDYAGKIDGTWENETTLGFPGGNTAPVLSSIGNAYAPIDATTTLKIKATDKDGDALSFSSTGLPAFSSLLDHGDGTATLTLTPSQEDEGTYADINIEVSDSKGGVDAELISIIVDVNTPPTLFNIFPVSLSESESRTLKVRGYDGDGDNISFRLQDGPPFIVLTDHGNNSASIDVTPRYGHAGEYSLTVLATDARGAFSQIPLTVTVKQVPTSYKVLVNFNDFFYEQAPGPWNNFARFPSANTIVYNLKDTESRATPIDVTILDDFSRENSGATNGTTTGPYPDAVLKSYFYGWDDKLRQIKISALDPKFTYKFTIIGSTNNLNNAAAPTEYIINGASKTLACYNNTSQTVSFDQLTAPEGEIIIGVKRTADKSYAYINALVIEAYYIDKTTPLTPAELTASWASENSALLEWKDNSTNETEFSLERSLDGETYELVASPAANTTSFTDEDLVAGTTHYYRVLAKNANGDSNWSNVAILEGEETDPEEPVDPDNKAPIIANFPKKIGAPEGTTTEIEFNLTDPNGDDLLLITRFLPSFAQIEQISETIGRITIKPTVKDIGLYKGIQFTAFDGSLEADVTFSIAVYSREKTSTFINIGNGAKAPAPWNNTGKQGNIKGVIIKGTDMLDETGNVTGYTLTHINPWTSTNPYGETSGNNSGVFPDVVTNSAYIIKPGSKAVFKISGLHADLRYNFVFFGSNIYKSYGGVTSYTIGNETVSLAIQSNIKNTVQINGVKADSKGEVTITVEGIVANNANKGGYLNAMVIEQYPENEGKILQPGRFEAHGVGKNQIDLSWTDNSHNETSFQIFRRKLPAGEPSIIESVPKNSTSYSDKTVEVNTAYEYSVRAVNSTDVSEHSEIKQAASLQQLVYINFNFEKNGPKPWNNLNKQPVEDYTKRNLINEDLVGTGISLVLDEPFEGANNFGPDAKKQGIYPDNVIKSFYFTEIGTIAKIRFYGLNDELTYNFRFFASSAFFGGESGVTAYRIGSKKVTLDVEYNLQNTAVIRDVKPVDGSVYVEVEAGDYARYGYLNALVIESRDANKEKNGATTSKFDDQSSTLSFKPDEDNQITTVYPNPTRAELYVNFTAKTEGTCYLQVLDMMGRTIYAQEVNAKVGNNTFSLDLRNPTITEGIYILKVKSMDFESKVIRFMKQ